QRCVAFFFSSRRRHTRSDRDWSSDVCSSDLPALGAQGIRVRGWSGLSEPERARVRDYFTEQVFPLLTPQAITRAPGYPFPVMAKIGRASCRERGWMSGVAVGRTERK